VRGRNEKKKKKLGRKDVQKKYVGKCSVQKVKKKNYTYIPTVCSCIDASGWNFSFLVAKNMMRNRKYRRKK
jgi:hypothetical protein